MSGPTGQSFIPALQRALIAALEADAGVTALVGARIYDFQPGRRDFADDQAEPILYLGEFAEDLGLETDGLFGTETVITINVASRSKTPRSDCADILAAMTASLHNTEPASLTEGVAVSWRVLQSRLLPIGDGLTGRGVLRLEARTSAA